MKKILTLLLLSISINSFSQVRISQVYGGGGQTGATYDHDFVELFNAGTSAADISNWSVQYASAGGSTWAVAAIPPGTSIAVGKYFLIELATGGAIGIALPTPDLINTTINISNTTGKVALVNNITALIGTTACSDISVMDIVGYGASPSCFETSAAITTGIDNTKSQFRAANGCTDTNDNSSDFSVSAVIPRTSVAPANSCGPASPFLSAGPNISNLTTSVGTASAEQTFILSGGNLTGFPSNISVTASAGLEVSLTSGAGFAGSVNVPYASATLAATTIYVRISAAASQGVVNGTVTNSGGGASNAVVTVNGGVFQNYYNTKAILGVTNTGSWSTTTDGTGPSPVNFTNDYQLFNIISQANVSYTGTWNVIGNGSKVIIGDGAAAINFTVLIGADSLTAATKVDVLNNGTLTIINNKRPFLNNLATGSTVDFAQTGSTSSDTIRIPNISFYNLKLTSGLKYFSPNTTTIRGDWTAFGVSSMNGSSPVFSTVNVLGNIIFNQPHFEPLPSGDAARITLAMNGSGTQNFTCVSLIERVYLFRLQRDSISTNSLIDFKGGSLFLGNNSGGGLRLNQGATTTTVLQLDLHSNLQLTGAGTITNSAMGRIKPRDAVMFIYKSAGNSNAGTLRIVNDNDPATRFAGFWVDFGAAFTRDSLIIADTLKTVSITLLKGKVVTDATASVNFVPSIGIPQTVITGGSSTAFIDGKVRLQGSLWSNPFVHIPIGKGPVYAPIELSTSGGDFTCEYFKNGYGNYTIDPTTLASSPDYAVSHNEYWKIDKDPASAISSQNIRFYYTGSNSAVLNPAQLRMAHFDATDWNDIGGTPGATNTTTNGYVDVAGVSTFSPFTFSALTTGVLPVRLGSFNVKKSGSDVNIYWTTEQEINSSHFIVQRSVDGRIWNDIATVAAAGNSSSKINYSTIDHTPAKGINYYRLKQLSLDGKFEYSIIKTIFFSSGFDFTVNPNPVKDHMNVFISKNSNDISTIVLRDVNGRSLKQLTTVESILRIDTRTLSAGVYFITVVNEGATVTKKVLIN